MTRDEFETQKFIDCQVARFHTRTGRYPTPDEAIRCIREGRRGVYFPAKIYNSDQAVIKRSYFRFASAEIIRLIQKGENSDPIRTIYNLWSFLDDMVTISECSITWTYAGMMRDATMDVLDLLG
jgi:hypothetical protein